MKSERFTKDISKYQNYCQFEVKDAKYKDIFDFESYDEIEECVDCDLSLAIDKLGQLEDFEDKWGINFSIVDEALEKGIYGRCSDGKIRYFKYVHIFKEIDEYWIYAFNSDWKFQTALRDFGDEWALTKEDLE